ncbi:MAG: DoxX family protein [Desulfobacteraceae bacterium]|jgi:hypothetical protein
MQMSKYQTRINLSTAKAFLRCVLPPGCLRPKGSICGVLRVGLGAVFVWSGGAKLVDPQHFAVIIESYGVMADMWVLPAALGLAGIELLAGLGLILDLHGALGLITGLLLLFMAILGYGLWMGLDIDCGCFGPHDPEAEAYHGMRPALYRDMAMLAAIGYIYRQRRKRALSPRKLSELYHNIIKRR